MKLPLSRHDLGVDAGDVDPSIQASLVVGLHNISTVDLCRTDATVVWPLRSGEASLWPAIWPAVGT